MKKSIIEEALKAEVIFQNEQKLIRETEEDGIKSFEFETATDKIIDKEIHKVAKKIEDKEVIEEPSREVIDQILKFKSRGITISNISKTVNCRVDDVERVIEISSDQFNKRDELINHIGSYDTAVLDIHLKIQNESDYLDKIKTDSLGYINPRTSSLEAIQELEKTKAKYLEGKTKALLMLDDPNNKEEIKLTKSEQELYFIICNNPKICAEEMSKKMNKSLSRVRQILNGDKGSIGLIKKGYVQGIQENLEKGGAIIYYSAIMR
jgi:hypothetical protein